MEEKNLARLLVVSQKDFAGLFTKQRCKERADAALFFRTSTLNPKLDIKPMTEA
jgi:hypothetical protein